MNVDKKNRKNNHMNDKEKPTEKQLSRCFSPIKNHVDFPANHFKMFRGDCFVNIGGKNEALRTEGETCSRYMHILDPFYHGICHQILRSVHPPRKATLLENHPIFIRRYIFKLGFCSIVVSVIRGVLFKWFL